MSAAGLLVRRSLPLGRLARSAAGASWSAPGRPKRSCSRSVGPAAGRRVPP
jgi:hypothetical protein